MKQKKCNKISETQKMLLLQVPKGKGGTKKN